MSQPLVSVVLSTASDAQSGIVEATRGLQARSLMFNPRLDVRHMVS